MGDCCSRPKDSEIDKHKLKQNNEHDISFVEVSVSYAKHELMPMGKSQQTQLLKQLETEHQNFNSKLSITTAGMHLTPKISIEIQKGVDLYEPGCFSNYLPFIKITLEPGGPSFTTPTSNKFLPEWYRLIEINQSLAGFTYLRFNIMLDNDTDKPLLFGKFDLSLTDLENQKVFDNWVKIANEFNDNSLKSRLKVRVQLIHDIRALYTVYLKELNEKIEEVEGFVRKA